MPTTTYEDHPIREDRELKEGCLTDLISQLQSISPAIFNECHRLDDIMKRVTGPRPETQNMKQSVEAAIPSAIGLQSNAAMHLKEINEALYKLQGLVAALDQEI